MIFYCCLCTSFPYDFDHERAREVANGSGRISLIMLQHSRNIKHLYRPYIIKIKIVYFQFLVQRTYKFTIIRKKFLNERFQILNTPYT